MKEDPLEMLAFQEIRPLQSIIERLFLKYKSGSIYEVDASLSTPDELDRILEQFSSLDDEVANWNYFNNAWMDIILIELITCSVHCKH
jgi:hypothetical protein